MPPRSTPDHAEGPPPRFGRPRSPVIQSKNRAGTCSSARQLVELDAPPAALPGTTASRPSRVVATVEVVLASGLPTQLALGTLVMLAGLPPLDADGHLSMGYVATVLTADTALLLALIAWRLHEGGEQARTLMLGAARWTREAGLGLALLPVVFGGVGLTMAALRWAWPLAAQRRRQSVRDAGPVAGQRGAAAGAGRRERRPQGGVPAGVRAAPLRAVPGRRPGWPGGLQPGLRCRAHDPGVRCRHRHHAAGIRLGPGLPAAAQHRGAGGVPRGDSTPRRSFSSSSRVPDGPAGATDAGGPGACGWRYWGGRRDFVAVDGTVRCPDCGGRLQGQIRPCVRSLRPPLRGQRRLPRPPPGRHLRRADEVPRTTPCTPTRATSM